MNIVLEFDIHIFTFLYFNIFIFAINMAVIDIEILHLNLIFLHFNIPAFQHFTFYIYDMILEKFGVIFTDGFWGYFSSLRFG